MILLNQYESGRESGDEIKGARLRPHINPAGMVQVSALHQNNHVAQHPGRRPEKNPDRTKWHIPFASAELHLGGIIGRGTRAHVEIPQKTFWVKIDMSRYAFA